jgi:hypothetical protein
LRRFASWDRSSRQDSHDWVLRVTGIKGRSPTPCQPPATGVHPRHASEGTKADRSCIGGSVRMAGGRWLPHVADTRRDPRDARTKASAQIRIFEDSREERRDVSATHPAWEDGEREFTDR